MNGPEHRQPSGGEGNAWIRALFWISHRCMVLYWVPKDLATESLIFLLKHLLAQSPPLGGCRIEFFPAKLAIQLIEIIDLPVAISLPLLCQRVCLSLPAVILFTIALLWEVVLEAIARNWSPWLTCRGFRLAVGLVVCMERTELKYLLGSLRLFLATQAAGLGPLLQQKGSITA